MEKIISLVTKPYLFCSYNTHFKNKRASNHHRKDIEIIDDFEMLESKRLGFSGAIIENDCINVIHFINKGFPYLLQVSCDSPKTSKNYKAMSTDSDDLDEDELLEIALKEQSQRDTNYQKPSRNSSKPVANYVQPPPSKPPANNSIPQMQRAKQAKRPTEEDDDDDSDIEMLSISSGDEDNPKDRPTGAKRPPAAGRGARDDDKWDGGEPDCWKRVDEAELGRTVREMRETKTAPVVTKTAPVRKPGLNSLLSIPRGVECVDPLGLGIIDNKTLRLITDKDPLPSDKDYVDAELRDKLMYFSEKFDAKYFLARIHQHTSAADLEAGALAIKTDLKGRTQQRKQLVKENFDCFVSCKTTIDDIQSKLKRIEEDPEGSGTAQLFNCIQGVTSLANRACGSLFERQSQADKIRSVQGMLQRFRTLFNLPSLIRNSISSGEYDLAVREYRKAKSIVLPSHVGILKRVLEEIEKVMCEFKGMLYKSMEDPTTDLTNLENIVRILVELEPESDPVWHYLNIQNNRIRGLLEQCTLDHESRMENLQNSIREKALSDEKWRQMQLDLRQSSDVAYSLDSINSLGDSQELNGEEVDGLRGRYIRRLTAVLIYHVPIFWRIALSVFSGKFAKSSRVSGESNVTSSTKKNEEKVGDGKYSAHTLDEVAGMVRYTISAYEAKVQSTFNDLEESNILHPYMSEAINEISKACKAFEAKEAAPSIGVAALRTLQFEITKIYTLRLCSWMRSSTEEIVKDESWVPVSILERNKSPYTISSLPLAFRSVIISAMDHISLMTRSLKSEAAKSEDVFMQFQEIQESVRLALLNCLLDFTGHLEQTGEELGQNRSSSRESPYSQNGYQPDLHEKSFSPHPESLADPHEQLLMVLSNIGYCKDELSRELYNKYKPIWQQSRGKDEDESDVQDLVMSFTGLEEKVLSQYTIAKANYIRSAAVNYLLDAGIQWGGAPAVKGVRDAAVELLHTLVAVHAEVFSGCKPMLDKTLGVLVEGLIDTLLSLFHENSDKDLRSLDTNGFCQLMLELEYFETILNPYITLEASESLKSLQGVLLEKATETVSEIIDSPSQNRRATRASDDLDDRQGMSVSPDDLIALAQQYSSELLQAELERTRINTACFVESIPLDSVPESAKAAYASFRGSVESPNRKFKGSQSTVGSPGFSRQRRR